MTRCLHLLAPLLLVASIAGSVVAEGIAGAQDEEELEVRPPAPPPPVLSVRERFDLSMFGRHGGEAAVRIRLDSLLADRIATIDRTCNLTDAQERKLRLVGRGDIKRFF